MSLGKLLTSGKSLMGLHDGESRYEMHDKNRLPKFGSAKNPFNAARPQPLQAEFSRKLPEPAARPPAVEPDAGSSAAAAPEVRVGDGATLPSAASSPMAKAPSRWRRWLSRLNPATWRTRGSNAQIPRFDNKPPVQGELSLERIQVVRNDLSEADLEVVPVKISVQEKATPPSPAASAPETPDLIKR